MASPHQAASFGPSGQARTGAAPADHLPDQADDSSTSQSRNMSLTIERVIGTGLTEKLYRSYEAACGPLRSQAAARHVLTYDEFSCDMRDDRIEKYVVWVGDSIPIGLATLTTDLSAISWISPDYYRSRYPDAAARNALYYLGYIVVDSSRRYHGALLMMTDHINRRMAGTQGVLGYDICRHNDDRGIGRLAAKLLSGSDRIEPLDTQSYYSADYR